MHARRSLGRVDVLVDNAGEPLVAARLEGHGVDATMLGFRRPGVQQELGGVDDAARARRPRTLSWPIAR